MNGLLIRQPWIDLILSGKKTWELRGSSTKARGKIALIESGTGLIAGVCEIVDVKGPLALSDLKSTTRKHCVTVRQLGSKKPYSKTHAWVLSGARRLKKPLIIRSFARTLGAGAESNPGWSTQ